MRFGILIVLVLNVALSVEALAASRWLVGENSYLTVVSNTSEKRALQIIEELQDVREVIVGNYLNLSAEQATERLTVIVCRDKKTFRRLAPSYGGKPMSIGGFFFENQSGAYAVIDASYTKGTVRHIIHHEYVHFLLKSFGDRLPLWLNEGLAEAFSTIRRSVRSGEQVMLVGQANRRVFPIFNRYGLMALERLFAITPDSVEYRSSDHGQGIFYAQSWALVHYMLFGLSDLPRESASRLFIASIDHTSLSEPLFIEATGVGFRDMEKRIEDYLRGGELRVDILPRSEIPESDRISFERVEGLEAEAYLGLVVIETKGVDEAHPLLKEAIEANPKSRKANEAMGFAKMSLGEMDTARTYLEQALRLGSNSSKAYLTLAYLNDRRGDSSLAQDDESKSDPKEQLSLIYKANALGETSSQLYGLLGKALLRHPGDPDEKGISLLDDGLYLYPGEVTIGLPLARLLFNRGDYKYCADVIESFDFDVLENGYRIAFERLLNELEASRIAK